MEIDLTNVSEKYFSNSNGVIKSFRDPYTYKIARLENGLRIFFVENPDTVTSSAFMNVASGSDADPENFLGLAHFLEHMLFMGSQHYPEEGYFSKFITQNGGSNNAFTGNDHTCFFFSIAKIHFPTALDVFSGFFTEPSFDINAIEREIQAVDSEHKKNIHSDKWRLHQTVKNCSSQSHPFSRFNTGDKNTLLKDASREDYLNLREALIEFYQTHYSAELMTLFIYHNNISEIASTVTNVFSKVPIRQVKPVYYPHALFEKPKDKLLTCEFQSIGNSPKLYLVFDITNQNLSSGQFDNSSAVVFNLIENEEQNSLYQILTDMGLITEINIHQMYSYGQKSLMTIAFQLTELGYSNYKPILAIFHQFIQLLKKSENRESVKEKWQEITTKQYFGFFNLNMPNGSEFLEMLNNMLCSTKVDLEYILCHNHVNAKSFEQTYQSVLELVDEMSIENATVIVSHPNPFIDDCLKTYKEDPYYNMQYSLSVLDRSLIALRGEDVSQVAKLCISRPNKYFPKVIVFPEQEQRDGYPVKIEGYGQHRFYFDQYNVFNSFNAVAILNFIFSDIFTAEKTVFTNLYVNCIMEQYNDEFNAINAFNKSEIKFTGNGVDLQFQCLDHSVFIKVLDLLFSFRKSDFKISKKVFDLVYHRERDSLLNLKMQPPHQRLSDSLYKRVMSKYYVNIDEAINCINAINYGKVEQMITIVNQLFNSCHAIGLFGGNIDKSKVVEICDYVTRSTKPCMCKEDRLIECNCNTIEYNLATDDPNSAAKYLVELDTIEDGLTPDWDKKVACIMMLNNVISHMYFDILRTKMQLGYIVNAHAHPLNHDPVVKQLYMTFLVQSPKVSSEEIKFRTEEFINNIQYHISNMPEYVFTNIKYGFKEFLLEKNKNIDERMGKFFGNILSSRDEPMFDKNILLANAVDRIDRNYFVDYFREKFINNRKVMFVGIDAQI